MSMEDIEDIQYLKSIDTENKLQGKFKDFNSVLVRYMCSTLFSNIRRKYLWVFRNILWIH